MKRKFINKFFNLIQRSFFLLPIPRRYCCICNKNLLAFLPYSKIHSFEKIIEALHLVGSDVKQFSCPNCRCHDRERHLMLYLQQLNILNEFKGKNILHFAPELRLSEMILKQAPNQYIPCDLFPSTPKINKVDMLDICYGAQTFDFVIANHVLEHVSDDSRALSEIHRVLKNGGYAILQTPFSNKLLHTFSDPGIDDDAARLYAYGQEDHVRLYGKDIFTRFAAAGFTSLQKDHFDVLPSIDADRYGVNNREPLFLLRKH